MTKDFVSIIDLMPGVFELVDRSTRGIFNTRRHPSRGEFFQYDVRTNEEGQKQLLFVDRRSDLTEKYTELTGEVIDPHLSDSRRERAQNHMPYVVGQAYDVPEILEVYYLRQSRHLDYITEAYLEVLENMYYHFVLAYVRSQDRRFEIDTHDYRTDKESNMIYRFIEEGNHLFQLNPDDENFAETTKELVCEKAEKLSKVKKLTKSEKNTLGHVFFPSRDLEDLLDYKEFYSNQHRNYSYESLTHYLPLLILHVAIAQDRQLYIGATYPEYASLVKRLPIRLTANSEILPSDYDLESILNHHLTMSDTLDRRDRLNVISYGHGVGLASSYYIDFGNADYLDNDINEVLYSNIFNQIRFMMFGDDDVTVPIDSLPSFENEIWRNTAGLRLSLNASSLDWSDTDE